ncbi:unnamed protein product [Sphagnum jensenii]|uniref:AP2/ERF domain-containing protein n=1 Tax=Sphagnum jensenii TaxID=128206 RepID=A0ABP1AMP9_9BRYO
MGDMVFDAEKLRPVVEYLTRVANDFSFAKIMFIKNSSLLLRDIPRLPANGIYSVRPWLERMALRSDSVVTFETEELVHYRGRDPVSAYPLFRLTLEFNDFSLEPQMVVRKISETLSEPLKFHAPLLEPLAYLLLSTVYFHLFDIIFDIKGSGQKQPNIHSPKYRGVRFRPKRSRTKPWTAELTLQGEENKVWIDDCNTLEAAALTSDVAAVFSGEGTKPTEHACIAGSPVDEVD